MPALSTETKTCSSCGTCKPLTGFSIIKIPGRKKPYPYRRPQCKTCCAEVAAKKRANETPEQYAKRQARWLKKTPGQRRAYNLKRAYGLTLQEFADMLLAQDGKCAICNKEPLPTSKGLFVDHCHATGKIRSLLCHHCNAAIGSMGDDPARLRQAANYIEKHASLI